MRILHVITGLQKAAGTSVFCGELCNQLVARGHEVSIAVCNPDATNCYPLDPRIHLVSTTTTSDYDLVHIHALWSPILHRVSTWARRKGIPIVWSPHGMITPWAMRNKWLKKLLGWWLYQRWDLKSAALLHATAQSEVDDIRRMGLRNKVIIAPLGVRLPPERIQTFKHSNIRTLLFVSRVQRKKGLPNLIEAWHRLPDELRHGWQVRIVGPEQDGHVEELKALCDQRGVGWYDCLSQSNNRTIEQSDIVFAGPKFDADLSAEYANADLFVLPTHSENFGSVVIESLAHGVPVITTKQAPWAELEEFKCGWWIDDTADALTAALHEAMECGLRSSFSTSGKDSASPLGEMGRRGRKLVEDRYTWSAVCDKILSAYERIC